MSLATAVEPVLAEDGDDGEDHVACCLDENVALCGADLTGVPWLLEGEGCVENLCRHCARLAEGVCGFEEDGWCSDCPVLLFGT